MLTNLQQELHKAKNHLQNELAKLQAGRANPAIVEGVYVMAYGSSQPLKNVAAVSTLDAQTIVIQPWDKTIIRDIEKGISDANLGLNPSNNGESLMIKIPPLTEERRRDLVKLASRLGEDGKVGIRTVRQDFKKKIDSAKANKEISEDEAKSYETDLQKQIDAAMKEVDSFLKTKEDDIMKV
ncbi:MAG: ribosome recycling factor [Candidatus Gracilibacteria bacterium]|nr:ribosome recycling factor [Candidatus Gracilibacteria bacterium]